jgi:unsaturated rhamnogalacturonyl hydrolase
MRAIFRSSLCGLLVIHFSQTAVGAPHSLDIGLTDRGTRIEGVLAAAPSDADARTVLLLGGLSGADGSVAAVHAATLHLEHALAHTRGLRVYAIELANPDGARLQFPPTGTAYREHPESHALWRWIGLHAPDLVLIAGSDDYGLASALSSSAVAEVGRMPAHSVRRPQEMLEVRAGQLSLSEAHREMQRRRARTPLQLAGELAQYSGHEFEQPLYIEAIALIAQLRLGHIAEVRALAEPYVEGSRDSLARPNSLVLAGHMLFTELARRTGDMRYTQRVRAAADLGFDAAGQMKEAMPYHNEFSDSLFMGTTILAQAGALTGESKYFDMAARHVAFMQKLDLRPDGLYRHQPATDAAWARGNAFAAIGLALALSEFPRSHSQYGALLDSYRSHMAVLAQFQTEDGLWRNVVDYPGAYPEFSATAMIGWAVLRGIERGWLDATRYRPVVDRAWRAVLERAGPDGHLVDVCESTARMNSLDEYLHRAAILGPDPRGGAMAMLFATELAGLE